MPSSQRNETNVVVVVIVIVIHHLMRGILEFHENQKRHGAAYALSIIVAMFTCFGNRVLMNLGEIEIINLADNGWISQYFRSFNVRSEAKQRKITA
jgi:hypothetical protein